MQNQYWAVNPTASPLPIGTPLVTAPANGGVLATLDDDAANALRRRGWSLTLEGPAPTATMGGGAGSIADGGDVAEGSTTDQPWSGTGPTTTLGALKEAVLLLTSILAKTPSTGGSLVAGQVKITSTGQAVQLPSAALVNGITVSAKSTNALSSSTYTGSVGGPGVNTTYDGTGNGDALAPGTSRSFSVANANQIYVNGTAGDVFSYSGN